MKYEKLELYLSEARLEKYLIACNNSKVTAKKLYYSNLRVCQSFYPVLNLFEIFIRNSINLKLSEHFQNSDWIITEKDGFMNNELLRHSRFYLKNCIEKSIRNNSTNPTADRIISTQTLGFWTALFLPHHYQLLQGSVINAFTNKPATANRSVLHTNLKEINAFRNRVYHNEPICFDGTSVSFNKPKNVHQSILNLIKWIDPELLRFIDEFDNIDNKITRAENSFILTTATSSL